MAKRKKDESEIFFRGFSMEIDSNFRSILLFGGPWDGKVYHNTEPPPGYVDTGGALAIWNEINVEAMWPK